MDRKGFTLIELMVVIAIIGILAAMLVPSIGNLTDKANAAKMVGVYDTLKTASEAHRMDTGNYGQEYASPFWTAITSHNLAFDPGPTWWTGWNGPYIHSPLSSADNPYDDRVAVYPWTLGAENGNNGFDLNNDGINETGNGIAYQGGNDLSFWSIPQTVAEMVNITVDGDYEGANWATRGKFEYIGTLATLYMAGGR